MADSFKMRHLLLGFPTIVVLLATAAFAFGGRCALWQWWLAALITVAIGFWRRPVREGVRTGLLFLGWMGVAWIGCGVIAGAAWTDEVSYHFPAVRMLAGGWNPLWDCSPEAALVSAGLEPGDCWIDHMVFMPKTVWIFDAVAWFFTDDVFNPLSPILWFLFPAVIGRVWRSMSDSHWLWKLLAVPIIYCLVPNAAYAVDAVVALSAIGLLLSFEEILSGRGFDALSLVLYSFWMMGAKTSGLMHGGFFWLVFLAFALWRRKGELKRLLCVVASVAALLAVANATPYLTSIRDYGHPFYPKYSFDEKRFPVRDLTHDFISERNEDAAQMGHVGSCINAFISPSLACAWYRWYLDRPDFMPYSRNYKHYPNDVGDGSCPTRRRMRLLFWLSLVWLFAGAEKSWRIPSLSVLLCIGAVPTPMLGYMRYIPWWLSPALFAYVDFARRREKWSRRALCVVALAFVCAVRPHTLLDRLVYAATLVERREQMVDLLCGADKSQSIRPAGRSSTAHLQLMLRQVRCPNAPVLLPCSETHCYVVQKENLNMSSRWFILDDLDEMRRRAIRFPGGFKNGIAYLFRTYLTTFPCAVADRIATLGRRECRRKGEVE